MLFFTVEYPGSKHDNHPIAPCAPAAPLRCAAMGRGEGHEALEHELVVASPLIHAARVVSDGRPYATALLALELRAAAAFAAEHDLVDDRPSALAEDDLLRAAVTDAVRVVNALVEPARQVRRFTILPAGVALRDPVTEHHATEIEAMYL